MQAQPLRIHWRIPELTWSSRIALHWAEMVEPLCSWLHQSLDVSHSWARQLSAAQATPERDDI